MGSDIGKYLTYYTLFYVIVIAWYSFWVNISGKNNAIAPKPGTLGFISYAGLQLVIVIGTVFFDIHVWDVWNSGTNTLESVAEVQTASSDSSTLITVIQALAVLLVVAGFGMGMWGYLQVLGYNMGSPWIPLGMYVGYGAIYVVAVGCYFALMWRRGKSIISDIVGSTRNLFANHWRQVDSAIIFFSFVFWIDFGFAVQLWSKLDNGTLNSGVHFPGTPNYFWIITFFSIFNGIFLPVFIYYFVTVLCMTPWMISYNKESPFEKSEKTSVFFATLGTPFYAVTGVEQITVENIKTGAKRYWNNAALKSGFTTVLKFLMWIGLWYQILFAFFVFYDLLHTKYTYLSTVFRPWYISNLVIQIFYWCIYFLYAIITIARKDAVDKGAEEAVTISNPFKHSLAYCQYIRPMVTFLIVVFLETFAMSELYKNLEDGHGVIPRTIIADPTNVAYLTYNGTMIIMFGLIYSAVLCFTDMMATLYSVPALLNIGDNSRIVLSNTDPKNPLSATNLDIDETRAKHNNQKHNRVLSSRVEL